MGLYLHDLKFGKRFLDMSPKAQIRKKKSDFIKFENLCFRGHHPVTEQEKTMVEESHL